jgi:phenylalanine-4-hydroxylase
LIATWYQFSTPVKSRESNMLSRLFWFKVVISLVQKNSIVLTNRNIDA